MNSAVWILCLAAGWSLTGCGKVVNNEAAQTQPPLAAQTHGSIEMVALPGGWFEMGSNEADEPDQKLHRVFVSAFAMDKFPVTQADYEKITGKNPSHSKAPRNPVEQIRWGDAALFCNARSRADGLQPAYNTNTWECRFEATGYRLPTEAEYEYALRAGTTTPFAFGNSLEDLKRHAWFKENSRQGPHPVGEKPGNSWGLCDLVGNVWEWCHDYYQADYYAHSPQRDPTGPATGQFRVLRGGCWNSKPDQCQTAYRYYETAAFSDACFAKDLRGQIGFRCVKRAVTP